MACRADLAVGVGLLAVIDYSISIYDDHISTLLFDSDAVGESSSSSSLLQNSNMPANVV